MAHNLYDMGDRHPDQSGSWLNDKQESRSRVLPVGLLIMALMIGGFGILLFKDILPAPGSQPAADGPMTISDSFSACDDPAGQACVLSPDSYAYHGRRYHLADISTPSPTNPLCPAEAARADKARAALVSMMNGGSFEARADPADADPSARILTRDGVSLGSLMILKDYAKPWSAKPIDWCAP
ncbi:MAG: nuclease [bacterium]|nr:nuclease [bacterium]